MFLFLIFFPANSFRAKKSNCFSSPWFDAEGFFRSLIIFALQPHSSKNLFVAPACQKPILDGFDYQLLSLCSLFYAVQSINISNIKRKILWNADNQTQDCCAVPLRNLFFGGSGFLKYQIRLRDYQTLLIPVTN